MTIEIIIAFLVVTTAFLGSFVYMYKKGQDQIPHKPKPQIPVETKQETVELEVLKEPEPAQVVAPEPEANLESAMSKTKSSIWGRIQGLFGAGEVDWEDIEEVLYTSDLGPQTVQEILEPLQESLSGAEKNNPELVKTKIKEALLNILLASNGENSERTSLLGLDQDIEAKPVVWMIVGVNGSGKTTSIGKLASQLSERNKKVMLAAGDTFRAAADTQLKVWAERAGVEIFSPADVKDPSAVAYSACEKAKAAGVDHLLIDTAGRLHTQQNLMEELKKMKRVVQKVIPDAPHETLIILDANNGQNALMQAKEFHKALELSGVIFTKMDGTAKGGVAFGVANELKIPIKRIGIGEGIADLRNFESTAFVEALF